MAPRPQSPAAPHAPVMPPDRESMSPKGEPTDAENRASVWRAIEEIRYFVDFALDALATLGHKCPPRGATVSRADESSELPSSWVPPPAPREPEARRLRVPRGAEARHAAHDERIVILSDSRPNYRHGLAIGSSHKVAVVDSDHAVLVETATPGGGRITTQVFDQDYAVIDDRWFREIPP